MNGVDRVRPYGLFVVPLSEKPVEFFANTQDRIGRPPVWKRTVTLPAHH